MFKRRKDYLLIVYDIPVLLTLSMLSYLILTTTNTIYLSSSCIYENSISESKKQEEILIKGFICLCTSGFPCVSTVTPGRSVQTIKNQPSLFRDCNSI